jgi:hypothetical protein
MQTAAKSNTVAGETMPSADPAANVTRANSSTAALVSSKTRK